MHPQWMPNFHMSGIKFVHSQNIKIPASKLNVAIHVPSSSLVLEANMFVANNALVSCSSVFLAIMKQETEPQLTKLAKVPSHYIQLA